MRYFCGLLWALAVLGIPAAMAGVRTEALLGGLKPGNRFEVIENISVGIPPLLRLLGELPPIQVTENAIRLSGTQGTADPVCVVSGLALGSGIPDQFKLPKGAMIVVKVVEVAKKTQAKYLGSAVTFLAHAQGTAVKAQFRCFAGKGSQSTMSVEVFERLFRRKVRLLVEER